MNDPHTAEFVTIASAASIAGIPERTIRDWVRSGKMPAIPGKRGKLVNLANVKQMAIDTGRRPVDSRQVAGIELLPATSADIVADFIARFDRQSALIEALTDQVAVLRNDQVDQIGRLEAELQDRDDRIAQLEALRNAPEPAEMAS